MTAMPRKHLQCLRNRFTSDERRGRGRSAALFILWFAGLLILFPTPGLRAQNRPAPRVKDDWYRLLRETPFERATFPFVLATDAKTQTGTYIAFPVEHVTGDVFRAVVKVRVESGPPAEITAANNGNADDPQRMNINLVLQAVKTGTPSGFCASGRTLPLNEVTDTTLENSLSEANSRLQKFYFTVTIPYWVGRVTILDVKLTGYRFIEKEIADEREEAAIRVWIKQLGAERFQERQAAEHQLLEIGEKAIPLLKDAQLDSDPERRERVRTTLEVLEKKQRERFPPIRIE